MNIQDKIIEELYSYTGESPCPSDIDEYWDNALMEMRKVERNVEFLKAKYQYPQFECYDMYFTGVKNARIHAKFIKPKITSEPMPAIVEFHGYSGKSVDWFYLLSRAACGFCVAALDCRGQWGASEDVGGVIGNTINGHIIRGLEDTDPTSLLFRDIFLDTAELADIVMTLPFVNPKRVMAMGDSQGGALALACSALDDRIQKAAVWYPFLSDYRRAWYMDNDSAYSELRAYFKKNDPCHEREDEIFYKLGYIDIQNIVKRIKAEVIMFTGLLDNICPPLTQFAAYNKITSPKRVYFYHDFGHEIGTESYDKAMQFFLEE